MPATARDVTAVVESVVHGERVGVAADGAEEVPEGGEAAADGADQEAFSEDLKLSLGRG